MPDDLIHCPEEPRTLVLASSSPRRRDLLTSLGLRFVVDASDSPEDVPVGAAAPDVVAMLAETKARAVSARHTNALVVGADTLVELHGAIFGKPASRDEARRMLGAMSAETHRVYTGLVLLDTAANVVESRVTETEVRFRPISPSEIDAYIATGEPMDKAGAYGMQGLGGGFVERIVGDYWNVVGLPLAALNELLTDAGCCIICRALHARRTPITAE